MKFFPTDTRKALSIQCYTHVGVGQHEINISNVGTFIFKSIAAVCQS